MRRVSTLIVIAIGAMALAGAASASMFTSPSGTTYTGEIKAESENGHILLESVDAFKFFRVECQSGLQMKAEKHGSGVTPGGNISVLVFNNCTNGDTVVVNKAGSLEAHALGGGSGTLTSSGAEITVHVAIQGIKCIYTTSGSHIGTDIGTVTGGAPATFDVFKSRIKRTGGSAFCGTEAFLVGNYKVTTPTELLVS